MLRATQILLLVLTANVYMPPAVEIPPVDENQVRSRHDRRDSDNRRHQQASYSYGTTAYHRNQQQQIQSSGYASAHLTNLQTQSRTVVLDRRTECQDPMLRTFFSYCHPPGTAPQSPVQCEPIPGQTTFRCLIKQQTWPVVRITQCPPGTASSNGDCVRIPGSFSTNGVMIEPVANSRGQRTVQTTVYRHCANGACQTCIGDQCSTTGIQTPVSVDHRGRANSTTEVVAFGDAGRDVKQKCNGRFCKTCIDRICYERSYPLLRVTAGCPPAVCDTDCQDFVYWTDNCPICRCRGFASREPCRSPSECPAGSACRNHICVYGELPHMHFDKVCTFSSQCPDDQLCYNWRCGAKPAQSRHLNQSCANNGDCPSGYICADMTCWQGDATRLRGQHCTLDHQCPGGYFCTNGTCTDVYHHGSFDSFDPDETTIPPTTDRQCDHDRQCHGHERCWERRCVTADEYRWMDEARRRQQSQHQSWRPQQEYQPTTTSSPQGRVSPDEEYQRRMAEYNRQVAEQQRQYEERRRQMEEERRRQEEAEIQRRRQEQEEAARRRQQQESERRRQEQEDERRRHELQEQRRRQQEQENQRRIQEQEEARRRETESQNRQREQHEREQAARRRQEQEAEATRRRQEHGTEESRRHQPESEDARRQAQEAEVTRRQQEQEMEEARRRQEQEEANRRQGQQTDAEGRHEEDHGQQHPDPGPDIEVGEETVDVGPYDDDEEYERRMQEYNRQLRERQRQLQEDNEEEPTDHSHQGPTPSTENPPQQADVEVSNDEDDFYGQTRQRGRSRDQAVSSYRVRYQRAQRRQ